MTAKKDPQYIIDELAAEAGGYFSAPSREELEFTDLFFSICQQFGIRYANATPKTRYFVDEVTRVTWAHMHGKTVEPCFSQSA
jgi:hypothetical protein